MLCFSLHLLIRTYYGVDINGNSCGTYFTKLTALNKTKLLRIGILQNKPHDTRTRPTEKREMSPSRHTIFERS